MKPAISMKTNIILSALVLFFACSKSNDTSINVETPVLQKECLSGKCVQRQFETAYQRFAIITGDMVNLRSKPSVTSRIIMRLPVTRKVTVLYVKPGEVTIGGINGRWVFARDAADLNIQGWLFDHFLGYTDCFKNVEQWKFKEIRVILGGKLTVYRCGPNGRFEFSQTEAGRKKSSISVAGDIVQCNNVIWLRKDTPDDHLIFFHLLKNGKLELPDQYKDKRGIVITNR
jgi:hypothetical protein